MECKNFETRNKITMINITILLLKFRIYKANKYLASIDSHSLRGFAYRNMIENYESTILFLESEK